MRPKNILLLSRYQPQTEHHERDSTFHQFARPLILAVSIYVDESNDRQGWGGSLGNVSTIEELRRESPGRNLHSEELGARGREKTIKEGGSD